MSMPNSYYIDTKGHLIVGCSRRSLISRIKENIFWEAEYKQRKNWRLYINEGREMIWLHT
jgi:hypothetical protein